MSNNLSDDIVTIRAAITPYFGGKARLLEYFASHSRATIELYCESAVPKRLMLECQDTTYIRGPLVWLNCQFAVERVHGGFRFIDHSVDFELQATLVKLRQPG